MFNSYFLSENGCVLSLCPDDLYGCSGWYWGDIGLAIDDPLCDEKGAALYKVVDGVAVERSEEERRADWPEEEPLYDDQATEADYEIQLARLGVLI